MAKIRPTDIQKYLGGVDYPARGSDLVERAEENEAPKEVVEYLQSLGEQNFDTPAEVMKSFGKKREDVDMA